MDGLNASGRINDEMNKVSIIFYNDSIDTATKIKLSKKNKK